MKPIRKRNRHREAALDSKTRQPAYQCPDKTQNLSYSSSHIDTQLIHAKCLTLLKGASRKAVISFPYSQRTPCSPPLISALFAAGSRIVARTGTTGHCQVGSAAGPGMQGSYQLERSSGPVQRKANVSVGRHRWVLRDIFLCCGWQI